MPKLKRVARLAHVPGIGVDKMGNRADESRDPEILRLENLDTDLAPPEIATFVTRNAIGQDINNSYLPFFGQDELRQAVVKRVEDVSHISYNFRSQCIITAGGMSGILNCLLATVEDGDEVIVTDPTYAGIINRIRIAGATPVFVPLIPTLEGWRLNLQALEQAATPRTRLILISPGMPTGHVLTTDEWEAVAEVAIRTDSYLLYDAAMEKILYDGRPVIHPETITGLEGRTITVGAASKELRMIGWRIGWVVGPESLMNDIRLVSISNVVCQTGISMPGVAAALVAKDAGLNEALYVWEKRRDCLLEELVGLQVSPPHGGWSLLMDVEALGMSSQEASNRLFQIAKIAATPMSGWGESAAKYVRLVFSNEPIERLQGCGKKIKKALGVSL